MLHRDSALTGFDALTRELRWEPRHDLHAVAQSSSIAPAYPQGPTMQASSPRSFDLMSRLGLDGPTPPHIRREAARELCAEIFSDLDNASRAHEFAERAAFILHGDGSGALPASPRVTAHRLCLFVAAGLAARSA
jgi:hypothetical protein